MKHMKIVVALSLIISSILWLGCAKSEKKEICSTCNPSLPELKQNILIDSQSITIGVYRKSSFENLVLAKVQNESMEISTSLQNLISQNNSDKSFELMLNDRFIPVNYNIYTNNDIRQVVELSHGDINGISIVMYKDFGLHHFFYKKDTQGNFILDQNYSATTDGLNYKDKYLLFDKVFNVSNDKKIYSLITLVTPPFAEVMKRIKTKNELRSILKSMNTNILISEVSNNQTESEPNCEEPCPALQDQLAECKKCLEGQVV